MKTETRFAYRLQGIKSFKEFEIKKLGSDLCSGDYFVSGFVRGCVFQEKEIERLEKENKELKGEKIDNSKNPN